MSIDIRLIFKSFTEKGYKLKKVSTSHTCDGDISFYQLAKDNDVYPPSRANKQAIYSFVCIGLIMKLD